MKVYSLTMICGWKTERITTMLWFFRKCYSLFAGRRSIEDPPAQIFSECGRSRLKPIPIGCSLINILQAVETSTKLLLWERHAAYHCIWSKRPVWELKPLQNCILQMQTSGHRARLHFWSGKIIFWPSSPDIYHLIRSTVGELFAIKPWQQ